MSSVEKPQSRRWLFVWLCIALPFLWAGTWWAGGFYSYWEPEAVGFSEQKLFKVEHVGSYDDIFPRFFPACKIINSTNVLSAQVAFKYEEFTEAELVNFYAEHTHCRVVRNGNVITISGEPWIERHYNGVQDWVNEHFGVSLWGHRENNGDIIK